MSFQDQWPLCSSRSHLLAVFSPSFGKILLFDWPCKFWIPCFSPYQYRWLLLEFWLLCWKPLSVRYWLFGLAGECFIWMNLTVQLMDSSFSVVFSQHFSIASSFPRNPANNKNKQSFRLTDSGQPVNSVNATTMIIRWYPPASGYSPQWKYASQ